MEERELVQKTSSSVARSPTTRSMSSSKGSLERSTTKAATGEDEVATTTKVAAIVLALMILLVSGPASTYSLTILTTPLEIEFNATRTDVSYVV